MNGIIFRSLFVKFIHNPTFWSYCHCHCYAKTLSWFTPFNAEVRCSQGFHWTVKYLTTGKVQIHPDGGER